MRSDGSRSGVPWTRPKVPPMDRASALASRVLPTPGTSSNRMWPPARKASIATAMGAGSPGARPAELARLFVARVRELNRAVGIPEKIAALKPADVPEIARAAMIEATRDYPVPKLMTLGESQALLARLTP